MTDVQLEARRELRERAFQALMSLEYEKDMTNDSDVEIPAFLLNLITGVEQSKNELDDKLSQYLKEGWTLERLTLIEKSILRLGLFEMTEFDTPQLVAINEAIELSKKFSDEKSSKFINGILSKFVIE